MTVVHDTTGRPRHPEKAHRPDAPLLKKPDWIRVKAPVSRGYLDTARDRPRQRPAHRVRGGRLPQYRRMLGKEARHLHDHGRHLHARLRLLQRQDRAARRARSGEPGASARRRRSLGCGMWSSRRSTATISPTAVRSISRRPSAPSARSARTTTIEVLTPDFLRKPGALETVVAAQAGRVQPQSRNRAVEISHRAAGCALLCLDPPAAAGEGNRSQHVHQVRDHGRAWRGAP